MSLPIFMTLCPQLASVKRQLNIILLPGILCLIALQSCFAGAIQAEEIRPSLARISLDSEWRSGAYQSQGVDYAPAASWVDPLELMVPAALPDDQIRDGLYNLVVDNQYKVDAAGKKVQFSHYADMVTAPKGLESVSQIQIEFDPNYQQLQLHSIWVHRAGELIDKTLDADFQLAQSQNADDLMYDGSMVATWVLKDIRVGDILEYSYSRHGSNPVFEGRFFGARNLQWSVPVARQQLRILWGKPKPLNIKVENSELQFSSTRLGTQTDYRLQVEHMPTITRSSDAAPWYNPFAKAYFSETDSWEQVVDWALPLFSRQQRVNEDIVHLAGEIAAKHDSKAEQLVAALSLVQENVRYLGLEMGSNSHFPSAAGDTLSRRYGDCKDKAVLLVTLLGELGVEASPALVNTDTGKMLPAMLPSADRFNHAIVRANLNGNTYWLDPTLMDQGDALEHLYQPDYGFALVLSEDSQELVSMASAASGSRIRFTEEYDFSEGISGVGKANISTLYQGDEARRMRGRIASDGLKALTEQYAGYYGKQFKGLEAAKPLEVVDDKTTGEVRLEEAYHLPAPWQADDDGGYTAYVYESQISPYLTLPQGHGDRALALKHPLQIEGTIRLKFRANEWQFDAAVREETNPFFDYHYSVAFDKNANLLTLGYRYQSKTDRVPADKVDEYIAALKKVADTDSYGIIDYNSEANDSATQETDATDADVNMAAIFLGAGFVVLCAIGFAMASWLIDDGHKESSRYYPVSPLKALLLSLLTFGLYPCYWAYKNWEYVQKQLEPGIWPMARAIFAPLWYYHLYLSLANNGDEDKRRWLIPGWLAALLMVLYIGVSATKKLHGMTVLALLVPALVILPLVTYINRLNGHNEAYVYNSRWRWRHWLLMVATLPVLLFVLAQDAGFTASDRVIAGSDLWQRDIKFMKRKAIIAANENPVLFYSDDWLSNQSDGNGFTDARIFSYWLEDGVFYQETAPFDAVKNIEVSFAKGDELTTTITVYRDDGSHFLLFAAKEARKDRQFVRELLERWRRIRPQSSDNHGEQEQ
ncbi:DUF3857 domain-containing transglutaminase family protein [Shewanella zhangzhouensis]|uniref:DUF3857 domain-containing transglutaminase family protein n=1 Tax=Shewanella zhangzhouensis TaxID=2864213 RepID=UPI001C65A6D4|nr:DUF3857 domain-containing transglutaminase family protein [Shewanella zhangzhouensis]QYK06837.1 DUF3857 domain-containing transglutaminase family protein [Shewanella zhangzhouensis]